jgi:TetR/AcrR family transcriptional repressor of nem operon
MRYEKGHKDATRQRIIEVASRQFREQGVAAVGLAAIMADAGLTNGAFYAHFESKEDLVRQVLSNPRHNEMRRAATASDDDIEGAIRGYLSSDHRDNPGSGCPIAALAAEIARHPKSTRQAFTGKIANRIETIAARLDGRTKAERRRKAVAIYGLMVGTLQLARAVTDKRLSDEILRSGANAAVALSRT